MSVRTWLSGLALLISTAGVIVAYRSMRAASDSAIASKQSAEAATAQVQLAEQQWELSVRPYIVISASGWKPVAGSGVSTHPSLSETRDSVRHAALAFALRAMVPKADSSEWVRPSPAGQLVHRRKRWRSRAKARNPTPSTLSFRTYSAARTSRSCGAFPRADVRSWSIGVPTTKRCERRSAPPRAVPPRAMSDSGPI